tara:strand:- start:175 stop:369 length:195 start_codon:yes stop_codon:yes gene_type:complete
MPKTIRGEKGNTVTFSSHAWDLLPPIVKKRIESLVDDIPYMNVKVGKEVRSELNWLDSLFGENF